MLYTNQQTGQRLIRVHTLALRVTASLVSIFKASDVDCVLSTLARRAITQLPNLKVHEIRTKVRPDSKLAFTLSPFLELTPLVYIIAYRPLHRNTSGLSQVLC